MANRTVYGLTHSSNGWPMVDPGSCTWTDIPGTSVRLQIAKGQPLAIMRAFAADYHAYVEPLRDPDSACWTPTNSVPSSNHLSGTAMDLNWNTHPFQKRGTFTAAQLATIRELQKFYEDTVFWGGDWGSPVDEMHWQLASLANGGRINTYNNPAVGDLIARKIRADGYSTFRRGNTTAPAPADDAVAVLAQAAGVTPAKAAQMLPTVREGLRLSMCASPRRIAYWLAQCGHESDGFATTQEYASGAAYEGRRDLGNTQPGDGVRFKGRGWIQVTGRHNYGQFSQWAHRQGLVPTPTYFTDRPTELADLKWAGVTAGWYWTVARPQINALCDAADFVGVTRAINGGTNGLADRQQRLSRAQALGDQLLTLTTTPPTEEDTTVTLESISLYATPGETRRFTTAEMVQSIDGMAHRQLVEAAAALGDTDSLNRIARVARGEGKYRDAAAIAHARAVLAHIESTHPEILAAYLATTTQKGA